MKVWLPAIKAGTGTDVYTKRLADALRRHGVEAKITWFNKYFELAPYLLSAVKPPPDTTIIHTNSWSGFTFKRSGIPLVTVEHLYVNDPLYHPYKNFMQNLYHKTLIKTFEHATFTRADSIIGVSNFAVSKIIDSQFGRKVSVIHNWVDTDKFTPPPLSNQQNNTGPYSLLFLGNLIQRKGADLLLPIMKQLGDGFELKYTGKNELPGTYPPNIKYLGRLNETGVIKACQECDALLFPSRLEGFGYVALEAMACGKPVIASNSSSLPEIVKDNINGILCRTDHVEDFAKAAIKLKNNLHLRTTMGENARSEAVNTFSEKIAVGEYIRLFESLSNQPIS